MKAQRPTNSQEEARMVSPSPIQHVVIIVKENHSFDNYFGTFPGANGVTLAHAPDPIASDPRHDHVAWLERASTAVRQQYIQDDIPAYWAYAQQYTLCDNYFTDVASQSEPNHLMLIAADAPLIDNASAYRTYQPQPPFALPSLPFALPSLPFALPSLPFALPSLPFAARGGRPDVAQLRRRARVPLPGHRGSRRRPLQCAVRALRRRCGPGIPAGRLLAVRPDGVE
jgi:hypothetical protein